MSDLVSWSLIVDDEWDCQWVYQLMLKAQGYNVHDYSDPIKSISEFKPDYYDLIILDYRMEDLDGLALV
jgi:DNA-binding response OmpR family regulator